MTRDALFQIVSGCMNDIEFVYNGKKSGVTVEVEDSVPTFQVWHGDEIKEYRTADEVMNDPFYSGKSLNELADEGVEFWAI